MKVSFLIQTVYCILGGVIGGQLIHYVPNNQWIVNFLLGMLFIFTEYLNFIVPLIILILIVSSILNLGQDAWELLYQTIILSVCSMLVASLLAYGFAQMLCSYFGQQDHNFNTAFAVMQTETTFLVNFKLSPLMDIFSILVLAISIGLAGIGYSYITNFFNDLKGMIFNILNGFVVVLIPYYVGLSFFKISYSNYLFENLFYLLFILICIIFIQFLFIVILYCIVGIYLGKSPITLMVNMFPIYLASAGIMSSTIAIPVTLKVFASNNITDKVSEFVTPICATIHLPGAAINQVFSALLIYYFFNGTLPGIVNSCIFLISLIAILVAAPSIPGGAVLSTIPLLKTLLLFSDVAVSLIYIISITNDYFSTGTNVMCDGAIVLVLDDNLEQRC